MAADDENEPKLSFEEASELLGEADRRPAAPTAEQFKGLVRDLLLAVNFVPDPKSVQERGIFRGMAPTKFIEANPVLKSLAADPAADGITGTRDTGAPSALRQRAVAQLTRRRKSLITKEQRRVPAKIEGWPPG